MNRIIAFLLTFCFILGLSFAEPVSATTTHKAATHKTYKKGTAKKKGYKTTYKKKGGKKKYGAKKSKYGKSTTQQIYHFGQGQRTVLYPKEKSITYRKKRKRYTRTVLVPQKPISVTFDGIDISRHQKTINWPRVSKNNRLKFVYIKATEGITLKDVQYKNNVEKARAAGYKVGSYLYFRPTLSAKPQFSNFRSLVNTEEQDLLPILDIEETGDLNKHLLVNRIHEIVDLFTDYYGQKPLIYTMRNFYNTYLAGEFPDYQFMIGSYTRYPKLLDEKQPVIWQFTCEGKINGISVPVDLSVFTEGNCVDSIRLDKFKVNEFVEKHPDLIRSTPIEEMEAQKPLIEHQEKVVPQKTKSKANVKSKTKKKKTKK